MFHDLDATLAALLASAPSDLLGAEASFVTPNKDYNPGAATVNFLLHGLQENRELRSSVPIITPLDDHFVNAAPPIRMDCTYLVTAWPASDLSGDLKVAEEHRLLGAAVLWVSRFPTVPDTMLQRSLKIPPQLYAVTTRVAQSKADESLAHFWNALGIAPRATFTLTATIAMQSSPQVEELPRVDTIDIHGVSRGHPVLTGRVLDAALAPVPGAEITVVENDRRTTSDQRGRFEFGEVPYGTYTLLIKVPNHPDAQESVTYQAAGQVHNIHLPSP